MMAKFLSFLSFFLAVMGLGLSSFAHALYLALTHRRLTARRLGFYLVFLPIFFLLFFIVLTGRVIDELFFRAYHSQPIHSPIFIIATPRSGTTLLHRTLCLDEKHFAYFRTYQTLLPSVSLYKFVEQISSLNHLSGWVFNSIIRSINFQLFAGWKDIHPTSLSAAEEDEGLFIYTFFTPAIYLLFPIMDLLPRFCVCDELPHRLRHRLMAYYKSSLQRFLFSFGKGRTLLSKNVLSIGRLRSLLEEFPDARLIYIVRHPYQAIPSLLSLFYAVWRVHSPEIRKDSPDMRALAQMGLDYYRYLAEVIRDFPRSQFLCIRYEELVSDLRGVIEKIYSSFHLTLDHEFGLRLSQLDDQGKNYQSVHHYSLEEYGLEKEVIFSKLSDVFDEFGFSR